MNPSIFRSLSGILASAVLTVCMLPFVVIGFLVRCVQIAWIAGWNGANSFWDKR